MSNQIDRRTFMRSTAAIGAGLFLAPNASAKSPGAEKDVLNVALLGAGPQGQVLMNACLKLGKDSGIRFMSVCDIWPNNLNRVSSTLKAYKAYGHIGTPYTDFNEMIEKEELDAIIVATPDFWHAEHTITSLNKGLHVYCEKEMSNTLEGARRMAEAATKTGKLLQIGHQRRSNPRYIFCYDKLIKEANILGHITTINGQWNRSMASCKDLIHTPGTELDKATLNKYGFESMHQFMNWRWFKGLGGGPIVDLGSHQIDIYSWFLEAQPKSVMASGGIDYWQGHQWYDNVMAIYEYETPQGIVRASYQTLTTNGNGGYYEQFMGIDGTLDISESSGRGGVYREKHVKEADWYEWEKKRYIKRSGGLSQAPVSKSVLDVRDTPPPPKYDLLKEMNVPYHQPHLVNFFDSVRGKDTLNCPAEIGYETAVAVLKVNEAVESGCKIEFKPGEFGVKAHDAV